MHDLRDRNRRAAARLRRDRDRARATAGKPTVDARQRPRRPVGHAAVRGGARRRDRCAQSRRRRHRCRSIAATSRSTPKTMQTSVPHIFAAGDVIGFPSLASTSMEQGRVAACHAFGMAPPPPPEFFPYGIYSVPEISTVGMTEEEVRRSARSPMNAASRAFARPRAATSWGFIQRHDEDDLLHQDRGVCSASTSSAKARPNSSISARRC